MKHGIKMVRKILTGAIALGFVMTVASSAKANTITVTSASVVGGVFGYSIQEDSGGRISGVGIPPSGPTTPFNSLGVTVDDYFTIYDFVGYTGVHMDPAGWAFVSQMIGPTDSITTPVDSPAIANLTWYKIGGSSGAGPFSVGGFTATSSFDGQNPQGLWTSEDTQNGGGSDGFTTAGAGTVIVPIAVATPVPEPASLLLLGIGLLGLASQARRRFQKK